MFKHPHTKPPQLLGSKVLMIFMPALPRHSTKVFVSSIKNDQSYYILIPEMMFQNCYKNIVLMRLRSLGSITSCDTFWMLESKIPIEVHAVGSLQSPLLLGQPGDCENIYTQQRKEIDMCTSAIFSSQFNLFLCMGIPAFLSIKKMFH